jgi:hypothetical protein
VGSVSVPLERNLPFAKPTPVCGIHLQQANRRSANRTATNNKNSVALEVLIPQVLPRMKQPDERAGFWIKSTQVRSLVRIAVVAGESEVFAVVPSAMLSSNDVLDVIGEERLRALRKATVFAAMISTFTDGLPDPLVHQAA